MMDNMEGADEEWGDIDDVLGYDWDNVDDDAVDAPEEPPSEWTEPWYRHEDFDKRTPFTDLEVGTTLKGEVSATLLTHGFMVDVGADYDGLVYVHEEDWEENVCELVDVGDEVTVVVKAIHENPARFVFVVELELVAPDISAYVAQPPRAYPPVYFYDADTDADMEELAKEIGRPVPERDVYGMVINKDDIIDAEYEDAEDDEDDEGDEDEDGELIGGQADDEDGFDDDEEEF